MRPLFYLMALCLSFTISAQEVIITGIVDGTVGAAPRAIELYVNGTVDLDRYALVRYANDSDQETDRTTLPAGSYTNAFVYVVNADHLDAFATAFGTGGDFANVIAGSNLFGNGNDAFALIDPADNFIDQTGGIISIPEDFWEDSWLYRVSNTGPDAGWVQDNWLNWNSNDALDGLTLEEIGAAVPFGTYTTGAVGPSVSVSANGNLTEPATNGGFTVTLSQPAAADLTVIYSLDGTATEGTTGDYSDPLQSNLVIPAGQLSADIILTVNDDDESEGTETITITLTGVTDATFTASGSATIDLIDDEPIRMVFIHDVQGTGELSPFLGQTVSVQAIVVGDFQGEAGTGLGGFFIQEENEDIDNDQFTSEGVFVTTDGVFDVNVGDRVNVTGLVDEIAEMTTIVATPAEGGVVRLNENLPLPDAISLDLPVFEQRELEFLEGMRTTLVDEAVVTETFDIARYGAFAVSAGERNVQFTECNAPDAVALAAYNENLENSTLIVDDGRAGNNNFPIVLPDGTELTPTNTLRSGTRYTGLTGIMDQRDFVGGGVDITYRLQFTGFATETKNERPAAAPAVGGNVTVVGMNVLNYFTTLNSRGADDAEEFTRQEAKIVAAICALDADVIGLVEIENNGFGTDGALQTLIDAIAAQCGTQYSFVTNPNTGTDEIQVALIYKADVVMESGTAATLATPTSVFESNRIPLAQTFRVIAEDNPDRNQEFTVCVNHWKSKGGSCGFGDDDNGGAGSCDGTRTDAAISIRDWLTTQPTGTTDEDVLIIGDLNAYSQEAPITTLIDAGYVNTVRASAGAGSFPCGSKPSYVFRGQWGSLDHALASSSLASQVTVATPWEVNAAEPTALDYDTRFNDPALYADDFYRFSDHNPIIVGLDLGPDLITTLVSFAGEAVEMESVLSWQTVNEENTDRFELQRQLADGTFEAIGTVVAQNNGTTPTDYTFTDTAPATGDNTYRLHIIGQGGVEAFSDLVVVAIERPNSVSVIRTGDRQVSLAGAARGTRYLLSATNGTVIERGIVNNQRARLNTDGLPAGIYFLLVHEPGLKGQTLKFVLR